ncbi:hypothetical protein E2L08_15240 [Palleronia sediminis]|uniref:Uncharacterized protein n=1 Tax=Palleronia sediminis TaxID=2547833 RepID=A0A4R6A335_9RHOB|nr:hypothetical protein [Palleronia sediminis]TDL75093.1 hypothetical protein E2L08_15240 [Palleronia sediminis]
MKTWRMFCLALALCAAQPAAAQSAWTLVERDRDAALTGAQVCSGRDPVNPFCFAIGCDAERPRHVLLTTARPLPGEGVRTVRVRVGGEAVASLRMTPGPDGLSYRAGWDMRTGPALVEALGTGRRAVLAVGQGDARQALRMPLAGSAPILSAALDLCPRPGTQPVADPAAEVFAWIRAQCAAAGGQAARGADFVAAIDLDGRHGMDIALDYGAIDCAPLADELCRDGMCRRSLYEAMPDGRFRHVFTGFAGAVAAQTRRLLRIEAPAAECGGEAPCERLFLLEDGVLTPLRPGPPDQP